MLASSEARKTASPGGSIWWVSHLALKKRGSLEQQILALATQLERRGVRLTLVVAEGPAERFMAQFRTHGVDLRTLDFARPAAAALKLHGWLRESRPALCHLHFVRAYSPITVAARLATPRVVLHDHVTLTQPSGSRWRRLGKQARAALLGGLCDCRVAVSRVVADSVVEVEHVARDRVEVIENGIDIGRFSSADGRTLRRRLAGDRALVACVARLHPDKGVETLVRAMAYVPDGVLALVGDGPFLSEWQALAKRLGVADRVHFLGLRDDVEEILAAADVVVVPSHWEEAFGLAVVEGMAAHKPVVVSRSGAMPQIVGDGGLVVPKRDPVALSQAILALLGDPSLRRELGRKGHARAAALYGIDVWVQRTIDLYDALCPALGLARVS